MNNFIYDLHKIDEILEQHLNELSSKSKIKTIKSREIIAEIYNVLRKIDNQAVISYDNIHYLLPLLYKFTLAKDIDNVDIQELKNFKRKINKINNILHISLTDVLDQVDRKVDNAIAINDSFETNLQKLSKEELINIIMKNK